MYLLSYNKTDSIAQFLTVLLVFIFVLLLTVLTTRYIASYQKSQAVTKNIDVIETCRITSNKYVQIIRLGDTYVAVAVCKDTITMLAQVPKEQIEFKHGDGSTSLNFKQLLDKALKKNSGDNDGPKEE